MGSAASLPLSNGAITRSTRSSCSLSVSWSRWVSRRRMIRSRAAWIASAVMTRLRSRPAASAKHASWARALTSHGWPEVSAHAYCNAASANGCPVSAVCWATRCRTSVSEKSPMRSDAALTLNTLPPVMTVFSAEERMR